jgi:hypothetical protein
MANALSLHIGLNEVDPAHYQGWSGPLLACEFDARDMTQLATSKGFTPTQLLTKAATRKAVTDKVADAATKMKSGDIFFITYSGHGGQVPDKNSEEPDGLDETWCLYDGQLVDDELFYAFGQFAAGVRILILSDSCHSGSVIKVNRMATRTFDPQHRPRAAPMEILQRTYLAHQKFYDDIATDPKLKNAEDKVKATALLISGCQDSQYSMDGPFNGAFTAMLKYVWNGGTFRGDYRRFHKTIVLGMPPEQVPNYYLLGAANLAFEKQTPFTV